MTNGDRIMNLKLGIFLLAAYIAAAPSLYGYSHWKLKDGTGSKIVRDSGSNGINGRISDPEHCVWGQEDDRGFFLSFSGGRPVTIPNKLALILEQGMDIRIRFSCDLDKIGPSRYASLLSKGETGAEGYSIMVGKNGELMLNFRRIVPCRKVLKLGIRSSVDNLLRVTVGEGKVKVYLNGKPAAEYPYTGTLGILGRPLYLGGLERYPFFGNIYDVKLAACGEKIDEKREAIMDFVPKYGPDPEGTVILGDFFKYQPHEAVGAGIRPGLRTWNVRSGVDWFSPLDSMWYPPADVNAPGVWIDPKLEGRYDVYVSVRGQNDPKRIQARIGSQVDYYTVTVAGVGDKHRKVEVLLERDVEMKGKKLYLYSAGTVYAGYIKLIPSAKRRDPKLEDPAGSVTRGPRLTQKDVGDFLAEHVINPKLEKKFFRERTYIETDKAAEPSEKSRKRGWQLFEHNWMDLCFKVSVPTTDRGDIALRLAAAPGEYEPVSFGVRGLRDVPELTLRQTTPFTYADGSQASVSAEIGEVESLYKRTTHYTYSSEIMYAPQYVERQNRISLKAGESGQFWITLRPDDAAKAGVCRAEFELTDGTHADKIPVELDIRPFKLDPLENMDFVLSYYGEAKTREEIDREVGNMARMGCTALKMHSFSVLEYRGDTAENFAIDWEKSTLPLYMEAFRRHGMTGHVFFLTAGMYSKTEFLFPKKFDEVYTRLLKDVIDTRKKRDWPEFVYMSFDEVLSQPNLIPKLVNDVRIQKSFGLKTMNDHIWYKTSRWNQKDCDVAAPLVDIFMNRFNTKNLWYVDTWDEMMARCKREGKELLPYNSDAAIMFAAPAAARYSWGWFARTAGKGVCGHSIYCYKLSFDDPYNDLDGSATDWWMYYPAFGDRKGGPTLNCEGYREGVDDLRYIVTLEHRIAEAEKRGIDTAKEKALLQGLADSFDRKKFYAESLFITPKFEKSWEDKGKYYASGRFNVPTGWDLEWYDKTRSAIADAIIALDAKLKNKDRNGR